MTDDALRQTVVKLLGRIAPEADVPSLAGTADIREAIEIDSFDFLNFVRGLSAETGVDVPEADYGRLTSLDAIVGYLAERRPGGSR